MNDSNDNLDSIGGGGSFKYIDNLLHRIVGSRLQPDHTSDIGDVVGEAHVQLQKAMKSIYEQRKPVIAIERLASKMATRAIADYFRRWYRENRGRIQLSEDLASQQPPPERSVEISELVDVILDECFSGIDRAIVRMIDDCSIEEIKQATGLSISTIKRKKAAIKRRFIEIRRESEYGDGNDE